MSSFRDILDKRLASGEISHEEYGRLLRVMDQSAGDSTSVAQLPAESTDWFYDISEEAVGPNATSHLLELLGNGTISRDTLVWRDGFADWQALSETELASSGEISSPVTADSGAKTTCGKCGALASAFASFCLECGASLSGYQNTTSTGIASGSVMSPQGIANHEPVLATFWSRVGASLIDIIPHFILSVIFGAIGGASIALLGLDMSLLEGDGFGIVISFFAWVLYYTLMESSGWQGTIGKKIMGIKVVDLHGDRIDTSTGLGRSISKFLSGIVLIGYLMPLWTKRRQALHDFMASTLVVRR